MANEGLFMDAEGNVKDAWGRPAELEEEGDADETSAPDYSSMTAQELKDEVARRQAEGREFDLSGVKVKADLVALLEADDEARAQED